MTRVLRTYHFVSIAGRVVDGATGRPLQDALVEITSGPAAYQQRLAAIQGDPDWRRRPNRPDRTYSRPDGLFVFSDLPAGDYVLSVSLPAQGTRYGVAASIEYTVAPTPDPPDPGLEDPPRWPDPAIAGWPQPKLTAVALPPTRIHGNVTCTVEKNSVPVPGARVRLLNDTTVVRSGADGTYALSPLVKSRVTVEATAFGYKMALQGPIPLEQGADHEVNVELEKE